MAQIKKKGTIYIFFLAYLNVIQKTILCNLHRPNFIDSLNKTVFTQFPLKVVWLGMFLIVMFTNKGKREVKE